MKRNKQSQQSLNQFMGGYSNFIGLGGSLFGNNTIGGSILTGASGNNTIGGSILTGASGNIPGNTLGLPTPSNPFPGLPTPPGIPTTGIPGSTSPSIVGGIGGIANTGFWQGGSTSPSIKHLKGNGKNVRLFEHCYTDKSFKSGWFDIVTPQKSKTVRLRLGRKGQTTNDTLSAVYVPKGYDVVLHEYPRSSAKFEKGKHKILRTTSKCLADIGWNDIVSEIDIVPQASGFGNIAQYVQSWGTRVDANPIQTIGSYGGVRVKPGTGRPLAPGDGVRVVTATPNRPIIPGKPAVFPNRPAVEPTRGTTNQSTSTTSGNTSGTNWTPPPAPSSPSTSDSSAPSFDQWMQDNARPVAPAVTTPTSLGLKESEEEESMWKNPLVWGGIAVVVIGLIYVLSPDKKAATVVAAAPTKAPVKAKARKGMKVRSGRKMSGRKMKRSGRIKK
jgi:hypothetical protein